MSRWQKIEWVVFWVTIVVAMAVIVVRFATLLGIREMVERLF